LDFSFFSSAPSIYSPQAESYTRRLLHWDLPILHSESEFLRKGIHPIANTAETDFNSEALHPLHIFLVSSWQPYLLSTPIGHRSEGIIGLKELNSIEFVGFFAGPYYFLTKVPEWKQSD